ncbi:hypothetical protein D3C76_948770 [compost metagenome]
MLFNDGIDQCKAQTGTFTRVLGGEEGFEQSVHDALWNSAAFVFHDQVDRVFAGFAFYPHRAARRRSVAGVREQVDQDLGEPLRVAFDPVVGVAQVVELHFEIAPVQGQQADGVLGHFRQTDGLVAVLVAAGMGEAHQRLHDARDALGLFEDLPADFLEFAVFLALFAQVLRQAGNAGDRVADFMGHARSQATDAGQALGMHQFVFEHLGFGQVFHQQHQATVARCERFIDRRFVQVQPASLAVEGQVLFVQVLIRNVNEALQQRFPRIGNGAQARTDHALRGDAGQFLHGLVPHEDFLILGQRANAHRQFLQGLAVIAAQGIEFGGQAGQARVVVLEAAFDEVDVFGDIVFAAGLVGQEGLDHVLGHARPHQA